MYDIYGPQVSVALFGLVVVLSLGLTIGLTVAAYRNHFWRKVVRPVVISGVVMFSGMAFYFGVILAAKVSSWLDLGYGMKLVRGPWGDIGALWLVIGIAAFFYTVALAYPDAHRGKGQPHDRTSHDD